MGQTSRFREILVSSAKVGVSTIAGLLGWVVGGKLLALELGAAGVGVFGLLRQLLQNLTLVSTFNGATALVQGIASREGDARARFTRSTGAIFAAGAGAVALVLLLGARWLGPWLVPHPDGIRLLRWLSLAVVATTAQAYFTGLLNGNRAIDALVRCQLIAPVTVMIAAYPTALLVRRGEPAGFVLLLLLPGAAVGLAAWWVARFSGWFGPAREGVAREDVTRFMGMSLVFLVTGVFGTGTQYVQNRLVAGGLGLEVAGHYWVAWTLSMAYVSILLNSYGTYYLPALSALSDDREGRQALIRDYLRLALLVMPILVSVVVLLKPWVILLMFSPELLPALKMMRWMLIGDLFKGISWIFSLPMIACSDMRSFLATEIVFTGMLAGGSWLLLVHGGGIESLGVLFLAIYVVYAFVMWGYVRWRHGLRLQGRELLDVLAGVALVVSVSGLTWNHQEVTGRAVLASVVLTGSFVLFTRLRWGPRKAVTS